MPSSRSAARNSFGSGASQRTGAPVRGCVKPSTAACSACLPMAADAFRAGASGRSRASRLRPPYSASPSSGYPASAKCARIWCVRPVSSSTSTSAAPEARPSTRQRVTARRPSRTRELNRLRSTGCRPCSVSNSPESTGAPCTMARYRFSTRRDLNSACKPRSAGSVLATTRQPQVFGREPGGAGLGDAHLDLRAGPGPQGRLRHRAPYAHRAFGDELLQPRARQLGQPRGEELVEAHPRLARLDPQQNVCHQIRAHSPPYSAALCSSPDLRFDVALAREDDVDQGPLEEVRARVEPGIYPALVVRAALLDLLGEHGEEGVVLDPFLDLRLVVEREVGGDGARQPVGRLGRLDHGRHG